MVNEKVIKEKPTDPRFKDWGRLGRWETAGWKLVEVEEGPRVDKLQKRRYMVVDRPWDVMYSHSYGRVSPFFLGLLEKKLMGTKCPKCGDVFCPPRAHCWRISCRLQETDWVEMPLKGTLHSYSIMGFSGEAFLDDLPFMLAYVRPDGCNTMIAARLTGIDPWDAECDMRVNIKFIKDPKGNPMDLYFVPDGKPKRSKSEAQKARIREKLKPIYDWVAKRKEARAKVAAAAAQRPATVKAKKAPKPRKAPKRRPRAKKVARRAPSAKRARKPKAKRAKRVKSPRKARKGGRKR